MKTKPANKTMIDDRNGIGILGIHSHSFISVSHSTVHLVSFSAVSFPHQILCCFSSVSMRRTCCVPCCLLDIFRSLFFSSLFFKILMSDFCFVVLAPTVAFVWILFSEYVLRLIRVVFCAISVVCTFCFSLKHRMITHKRQNH